MLDRNILGLVELSPNGLTNGQLLWRLNAGGRRYDASELLDVLQRLSRDGDIRSDGTRWKSSRISGSRAESGEAPGGRHNQRNTSEESVLHAAPAAVGPRTGAPETPALGDESSPSTAPDATALLTYYAATQRRDPRGSIEAFPDGHGAKWHLFHCRGRWWESEDVSIRTALLEPRFLQALAESGPKGVAAVGWPVSVFRDATGTVCLPGLLLPVSWVLKDEILTFAVDAVQPALNPTWVRHVKRLTGLATEAIERAMEPDEDGTSLDGLAHRFAHLLAQIGGRALRPSDLAAEVALAGEGLRNSAALFLPDEAMFTRRVAQDLDQLAQWPAARSEGTALHALLSSSPQSPRDDGPRADVVEIDTLTEPQFFAADAALSGRLTAIQGPPGTGKSQTIVILMGSALAAGQTVLFVARNHRALDEVEGRLSELLQDSPVVVRARDAGGERDTSTFDALVELTNSRAAPANAAETATHHRRALTESAAPAARARRLEAERTRIHLALAEVLEREEELAAAYTAAGARLPNRRGLLAWLRDLFRWRQPNPLSALPSDTPPDEVRRRIAKLRQALEKMPDSGEVTPADARRHLPALVSSIAFPDEASLLQLRTRKAEIDFEPGSPKMRHITVPDAELVLQYRPLWAASTLSVPARIPLAPGLFDLAIFDEASQCDIASALPILARAKRAVIVGDPEQLSFIPSLGNAQEHALMDAAGLPKAGRATWAQSTNSLFDLARARIGADQAHLLSDQFRSAPAIVDYTSATFYGGRLRPRRSDDEFSPPKGYRPGLHWADVRGPCTREDGGNINRSEAEWIVQRMADLALEEGFEGSVGVVSPFSAQVGLIRRLAGTALSSDARARLKLNVNTVDGWQGGEADVIFFSLAIGPTAAHSAISFLVKERRRFNVAVSRARAVAVVVGDLDWAKNCRIPHVGILAERATRMSQGPIEYFDSKWERRVHEALLRRGLKPEPQYALGSRRLDFAIFQGDVKLDLEVDGRKWHTGAGGERKVTDRLRDREVIARGWKVRRFWVDELAADLEGCLDIVERDLGLRR